MYTLDRFARNRYDSAIYKNKLKKNGVRVLYAKQPMPDTPEGIILESMLEGYAEYYSENLSRGIKRGMKENALHGIAQSTPPLGYKIGADRHFEIEPIQGKAVREIFRLYSEGKSKAAIVNYLNDNGFKTSRGNRFNKNSLYRILTNETYIGIYKHSGVVLEDAVPPLIDKQTWDSVQALLKRNSVSRARNKATEKYLLSGKVFCGHCGKLMIGESGVSKTGKPYRYYKCAGRKREHNCNKKVEKKEWLEQTVVQLIVDKVLTDETIERIATKTMEVLEKEYSDTSMLHALQERLKEVEKRINNIMEAIEQGIITPTTKTRLEGFEQEKLELEGQIIEEEKKKPSLTKELILQWLNLFRDGDIKNIKYQRKLIDTFLHSVYVYDDGDKGRKLVLIFNLSGENTETFSLSDIDASTPPKCAYPNSDFVINQCFGFCFYLGSL